jgi:multimeric flavodoxin WrbA
MDLFRQGLSRYGEVQLREIVLPKDMPDLCVGCFSCFYQGEQTCPHSEKVSRVVKAMEEADLIIMTSPVYACDITANLKTLLDHLSFMWLSHRPNPKMFHKAALTIATTAGAGLSHTTKTMKNSLSFWGIKKIYTFKKAVAAMKRDDVTPKNKARIEKTVAKQVKRIYKTVQNMDHIRYPFLKKMMFRIMRGIQISNNWNPRDRKYWEDLGWLGKVRPY